MHRKGVEKLRTTEHCHRLKLVSLVKWQRRLALPAHFSLHLYRERTLQRVFLPTETGAPGATLSALAECRTSSPIDFRSNADQERIVMAFFADGCRRTVSRIYDNIVIECQKLFANGVDQLLHIAAG